MVINSFDLSTSMASGCQAAPDSSIPGSLYVETFFTYTSTLQFNTQDKLISAEGNGAEELASSMASLLGVSSCVVSPGGSGDLKIGVSVLTSVSVQYVDGAKTTTPLYYPSTSTT